MRFPVPKRRSRAGRPPMSCSRGALRGTGSRMATDPGNDDTAPATGMATGNDEGTPGERLGNRTLDPEEQAVLEDLREGGGDIVVTDAEEDSPAVERAVEDDTPVPGEG